jgi:hypothetical protein
VTPEEVAIAAIGLCADYTNDFPTTRALMYRRISARQRELFSHVATLDPEVYGAEILVDLEDGFVNLSALEQSEDVYPIERIEEVQIAEVGSSLVRVAGEKVSLVRVSDPGVAFPPRATYRSGVLRQVADDLAGVASLRIFYSRRPRTIQPDGSGEIEFLEPFQELLIYDLARDLIRRTVGLEGEQKGDLVAMLDEVEKEMMDSLASHISHAGLAREDRFHVP